MKTQLTELWELIVSYAKQETVDPLKRLTGFVKWGLTGSALLAVGYTLLSLTMLRALQTETFPHWTGNWSWVPYALTLVGSLIVATLLALMITADRRRSTRRAANSAASSSASSEVNGSELQSTSKGA